MGECDERMSERVGRGERKKRKLVVNACEQLTHVVAILQQHCKFAKLNVHLILIA